MKPSKPETGSTREAWAVRRKSVTPKTLHISQQDLVTMSALPGGGPLPLVVQPSVEGVNLITWAANNVDVIESNLLKFGGILFRGFGLEDHTDFDQFLHAIALPRMHYMEGATPRMELADKVYTSTEYPSDQHIALHNELNYVITWPMKIFFFCVTPPEQGGETPIADVRNVNRRIDSSVRQQFIEKGWMLARNFGDGMSLPWQTSFRLSERAELESYCRASRIECEWKGADRLRTRQVRPSIRVHPRTGEQVWFNHLAFWHVSSLEPAVREVFLKEFAQEELPYNTYFGDGTPVEDAAVEEIRRAYREETVAFAWQKGDLLMLDNMLVAHGRHPFSGPRKILTAMGEPYSDQASWDWPRKSDTADSISFAQLQTI
jgi:alpha-ketoglutarate-dependent taurine dioxygenase